MIYATGGNLETSGNLETTNFNPTILVNETALNAATRLKLFLSVFLHSSSERKVFRCVGEHYF